MEGTKEEEQKPKCYVISIESRKGGVGKTTVALNTGRILLEENYEVVFFNFDFQGTDLNMLESSMNDLKIWGSFTPYMVEEPPDTKKKSAFGKKINLVKLFDDYMGGKGIPDIGWNEKKEGVISLKPGKINILCSRLKREGESKKNLYEIATLFDEMHSAWFLSMIKEMIKKIWDVVPGKKNLAIILDNGTGFTGLEPSVDEWLTDIGPRYGKFLFVCTLDSQDFIACAKAVCSLHSIYSEKWDISQYLGMGQKDDSPENYIEIRESLSKKNRMSRFFYRLVDSTPDIKDCEKCNENQPFRWGNLLCPAGDFCFYLKKTDENNADKEYGDSCMKKPGSYMGITVNKIPKLIYDNDYKFDIERVFKKSEYKDEKDKTHKRENEENTCTENVRNFILKENENRVPYRDELAYQFIDILPNKSVEPDTETGEYKISSPRILFKELKEFKDDSERKRKREAYMQGMNDGEKGPAELFELFLDVEFEYDRLFKSLFEQLKPSIGSDLSSFRIEDFYIIKSKKDFFERVFEILKPSSEYDSYKTHAEVFTSQISGKIKEKSQTIDHEIAKEAAEIFEDDIYRTVLNIINNNHHGDTVKVVNIVTDLNAAKMLSLDMALLKGLNFDKTKIRNLIIVLKIMHCISIQKADKEKKFDMKTALNSSTFWKARIANDKEIGDIAGEILELRSIQELVKDIEDADLPDHLIKLYKAAVKTRIRLLDLHEDFKFLYDCFRLILLKQQITSLIIVPITKIAREVVLDKLKSPEEGREKLQSLFLKQKLFQEKEGDSEPAELDEFENDPVKVLWELERMDDFDRVIRQILSAERWDMI